LNMEPLTGYQRQIIFVLLVVLLSGLVIKIIDRHRRAVDFDIKGFLDGYKYTTNSDTSEAVVKATTNVFDEKVHDRDNVKHGDRNKKNIYSFEKINVNKVGAGQLQKLPGIGPVLAQGIIAYRDSVGLFHSEEDLLKVNGIGPKKLSRIAEYIEF
jgi:competence ComEA-like helix-hairpin-helix protein